MGDGVRLSSPPRSNFSAAELRAKLDQTVMDRLLRVLPALVVLYLLSLGYYLFYYPLGISFGLAKLAGGTVLTFAVIAVLVRRGSLPVSLAHPVGCLVAGLVVLNSFAHLRLLQNDQQVAVVLLTLIGAGGTFLSAGWLLALVCAVVMGWGFLLLTPLPFSETSALGLGMAVAASFGLQSWRLRAHRRQVSGRLLDGHRRRDLQQEEKRYALAVEGTKDGLWYWDLKADKFYVSPLWAATVDFKAEELSTKPDEWLERIHPYYVAEVKESLSAHLYGKTDQFQSEYRIRHRNGSYVWVLTRGVAERDEHGDATAIAGSQTDITRLMDAETRAINDAFHDKLTGLPNRHYFLGRLQTALERWKRSKKEPFAVVFLDLDRFKLINDSLGHLIGDQLLAAVAGRLRGCQRPNDTIARFGGDEFVILLEGLRDAEDAIRVGNRIKDVLTSPFKLSGHEVVSGGSIGIALSDAEIKQPEDLLRNADTAMYYAKTQRKGHVQVFNQEMHAQALKLLQVQNDLGRAVERQELQLHYQPIISLESGKIAGAEALLRWQRPGSGLLAPAHFIEQAEEMGLIMEIGEWALRTACQQGLAWQQAGLPPLKVTVNLSARQLQQRDFPVLVSRILAETNFDPRWLELELTETALMDSLDVAPATLEALSNNGIRIAIDDFGTGYSSLSYLRRFSFDTLKIDRSFVVDVAKGEKAASVTKGLIALAHNLDLRVTAEGVETLDQLSFLVSQNCHQFQGFLASRPLEAARFAELLRSGRNYRDLLERHPVAPAVSAPLECDGDLERVVAALSRANAPAGRS